MARGKTAEGWERLHRLGQALEGAAQAVGRAAGWLALALVAVILFDVVMRRWFVVGSTRLQELEWHLHGALFLLPFLSVVIWFGWDYVALSFAIDEASPSPTGLPHRWIIKGVMLIGFLLLGCAALARVLEALVFLFGPRALAARTDFARPEATHTMITEERI